MIRYIATLIAFVMIVGCAAQQVEPSPPANDGTVAAVAVPIGVWKWLGQVVLQVISTLSVSVDVSEKDK